MSFANLWSSRELKSEKTHLRALTIRTRLTLWSATMIVTVYAILAGILFWGLAWLVQTEVDALVEGQAQELVARLHKHHDNLQEAEREVREELSRRIRKDFRFRVVDGNGKQLLTSDLAGEFPPVPHQIAKADGFVTLRPKRQDFAVRVYRQKVLLGDRTAWAEVTYSLDQMTSNLWHYAGLWLASLPLVVLLAGTGGWLIARRSLKPVADMIEDAKQIEGDPSVGRIEVRRTGDELDQLAETLNRMLDRIEHHVKQITQFTADASHELRSPLAALRGAAEVALSKRSSADELRGVLENAVEQYDRLTRIAENLLLLARIDARQYLVRFDPVSAQDLLTSVAELYAPIAENRHLNLTCSASTQTVLHGDFGRLFQLIGNLIDNALKNTPAGGRVELRLQEDVDSVRITVKDTGVGIAAAHQPRVFDRFYRADDSRNRSVEPGAGLGLSICKAIVELHGGNIALTSREGHGTEVCVRLPIGVQVNGKMNELSSAH